MRRIPFHRPSPSMMVALLALFIALAGTAVAAKPFINGKNIKKRTIPANRIKRDSLTGNEIKESTLGTVPSATLATLATNATNATNSTTANSASALNGVQVVRGPDTSNPHNSQNSQLVACPNGMKAIGGGTANNGNIEESINDAHIASANGGVDNAFLVHMNNISGTGGTPIISGTDDTFHVYVICINGSVTGNP